MTAMVETCRSKELLKRKRNGTLLLKKSQISQEMVKYLCKMSAASHPGTEQHNALSHTMLSFMCIHIATGKSPTQCIFIQLLAYFITSWIFNSLAQGILLIQTFCLPEFPKMTKSCNTESRKNYIIDIKFQL